MTRLQVHYLPQFVAESDLAGSVVVVVDLLRASTTICHALAAGAECVVAFTELDAAAAAVGGYSREEILLTGERGGLRVEGFDLGNSPQEFSPEAVSGRRVLFTTTNGTRALAHARLARCVLVGAAVNRMAIVDAIRNEPRVDILCAGTNGKVTREDVLVAGAIAHAMDDLAGNQSSPEVSEAMRDADWAAAARREWDELRTTARALGRTDSEQFTDELRRVPHGQTLIELGFESDLDICAQLDALDVVPQYDPATGEIRLA